MAARALWPNKNGDGATPPKTLAHSHSLLFLSDRRDGEQSCSADRVHRRKVTVTPLVLRTCLAPRFRPKKNFRIEFYRVFNLNVLEAISESCVT